MSQACRAAQALACGEQSGPFLDLDGGLPRFICCMPLRLFEELYYMTHYQNVGSILERGILSHSQVEQLGLQRVDISDPGVQRWRALPEPVFGRPIHAYAPLYFNPRNPMLFARRAMQRNLVLLRVSADAVHTASQALFTDGNAACRYTQFSTCFDVVRSAWPVLEAAYWNGFSDGTRMRCAEALVLDSVAPHFILGAACNNPALARHLQLKHGLEARVDGSFFF